MFDYGAVTALLQEWSAGSQDALARLMPLVYSDLHRTARSALRRERPRLLKPEALVNEVYLRLVGHPRLTVSTPEEFFLLAAQLMRRILIDHYRHHRAAKRPPPDLMTSLTEEMPGALSGGTDLIDLDAALSELQEVDPRRAKVVEMLFFMGMSVAETASVLGVSARTVERDFRLAKAVLSQRLRGQVESQSRPRSGNVVTAAGPERPTLQVQPDPRERYVNSWLVGAEPPLTVDVHYQVGLRIGPIQLHSLASEPFREPSWETRKAFRFWVMLWSRGATVEPNGHTVELRRESATDPVFFRFTPRQAGDLELRFLIFLEPEAILHQELRTALAVLPGLALQNPATASSR